MPTFSHQLLSQISKFVVVCKCNFKSLQIAESTHFSWSTLIFTMNNLPFYYFSNRCYHFRFCGWTYLIFHFILHCASKGLRLLIKSCFEMSSSLSNINNFLILMHNCCFVYNYFGETPPVNRTIGFRSTVTRLAILI